MAVVLIEFIMTPQSLHHSSIILISHVEYLLFDSEAPDLHIDKSSANRDVKVEGLKTGKVIYKILKRIGLKTHPCGIPLDGEKGSERYCLPERMRAYC